MVQCSRHVIPPAITANLTDRPAHDLDLELNAQRCEVLTGQRLGTILPHREAERSTPIRVVFWVRVVTSPKRRCSGSSRPRWLRVVLGVLPGPAVTVSGALGVGDEVSLDDVADLALQRPDRFPWVLPSASLRS